MRAAVFCFTGAVGALLMVDYVVAGSGPGTAGAVLQSAEPHQHVMRDRKGDRLSGAARQPTRVEPAAPAVRTTPPSTPHRPKLPDGCEPAYSRLTGAALSGLHARCVAELAARVHLAALH